MTFLRSITTSQESTQTDGRYITCAHLLSLPPISKFFISLSDLTSFYFTVGGKVGLTRLSLDPPISLEPQSRKY
jgi:hypothetical protein